MRFPAALLALLCTCGAAYAQLSTGGGIEGQSPGTPPAGASGQSTAQSYHGTSTSGNVFLSNNFTVDGSGNVIAKSVGTLTNADPTGATDSAPAFRAAIASNKVLIIPPGTYLFKTTQAAPCCAFDNPAVLVQLLNNFTILGYGATINIDPSIALSSAFHFDQNSNFQVYGLTINGSRSGLSDGQENVAITLTNGVNFHVSDIHVGTGFNAFNGAAFAGDWLVNGVIDNIQMDSIGICYDFAYLLHMKIGQTYAKGQSTTSLLGDKCFSVIVDGPNSANNHTGVSFTATDDVLVTGLNVSNFNTGALIVTGTHYTFTGNSWHDNPGQGSTTGIGLYIAYNPPGGSSSVGASPSNITISGDRFYNNGTVIAGWGLLIDTGNITNSDVISNITISGSLFDNNNSTGIGDQLTAHTSNFTEVGNIFSGSNQTTDVVTNFKTVSNFYVDASGSTKVGNDLNVSHNLVVSNQIQMTTNNSSLRWADSSTALQPVMGVSPANITFLRPASTAAYVDLQTFSGVSVFHTNNDGSSTLGAATFSGALSVTTGTNPALTLTSNLGGSNSAGITMNSVAADQAALLFRDNSVSKWQVGKNTDNSFFIFDAINTANVLSVTTTGIPTLGEPGRDVIVGGSSLVNAATTGFAHLPFSNQAGGVPTGTPGNTTSPACEWNDISFTLNCYSPSAGAWKHVTFSAGAS